MFQVILMVFFVLISECWARDALTYFANHRTIQNSSITVLSNLTLINTIWVEYNYLFNADTDGKCKENQQNFKNVLNVGVFENINTPFDCNILSDGEYTGYSFEILNLLQERLNFDINYVILNYSTIERHLKDSLMLHQIDLLICHPEIDFNKESELSQLHPTLKSNYLLIYKPDKLHFTKDIFILTFSGTLWLCFFILLIILAICLHISTKHYSMISLKYEYWNWVDITLWANAAACQQGLSHTPNGFASRTIFFLGYLTAYLLYTGFAAGITSLLLKQSMNSKLTLADIADKKIAPILVADIPLLKYGDKFMNNSKFVSKIDDLFQYIDQDNTVGIAPKIFVDQFFARKFNYDMINLYSTAIIKELHYNTGIVVLKNSSYKRILNEELIVLQELGLLKKALEQNLLPTLTRIVTSNYSSAGIEHLGSAILVLVVGTLGSTVFLVAELTIALYQTRCYHDSNMNF